jgi:hypothetical protein
MTIGDALPDLVVVIEKCSSARCRSRSTARLIADVDQCNH